jgi:AcrR family transcriptional regulator
MENVTESEISSQPKRGRPRSEEVEQSILRAASELLRECGFASMSIEEVAARAGVGKASIYRRWSSKGALALEAFLSEFFVTQPLVDTGSIEGDMFVTLMAWVRAVSGTPDGRTLVSLIAEAQLDPGLADAWRNGVVVPSRTRQLPMIERAIARGEIPSGSDIDVIMDMLYGPAYHRLLHWHLPLSEDFVRRVVAVVVAGAKAGAAVPTDAAGF